MVGWTGVDLDGTLAHYDGWVAADHIGDPVPKMQARVLEWLDEGRDVRIVTARVSEPTERDAARAAVEAWCLLHLGRVLPVTHEKDHKMVDLWDDRVVQVERNTGQPIAEQLGRAHAGLLRALDYRAATPEGIAIREDIRAALRESGFTGTMGVMGS